MSQDMASITSTLATFVDYWWAWLVPVAIAYVLRRYIANIWYRIIIQLSDSPYTNVGNVVQFSEGGTKWRICRISKHSVYFKNSDDNHKGDLELMRMPIDRYYNSTVLYKEV